MIYFFHGKDKPALYQKASKLFESLRTKKPDATFMSYDAEKLTLDTLDSLSGSQGLFENKIVAYLNNVLTDGGNEEEIFKRVDQIAESQNIFIWSESDLSAKNLAVFKKKSEKCEEIEDKKNQSKKSDFNIFNLADAFGRRDRKNLWALFQAARKVAAPEEIHGILFWQLKNIALAHSTSSPAEADLKPFVYSKAKSFAKNYSREDIKKISSKFVEIYHDAHRGKCSLDLALEALILSL